MFRFVLSAVLFAANWSAISAATGFTCDSPTPFSEELRAAGETSQALIDTGDDTIASDLYFSLTVVRKCNVTISVNTCSSGATISGQSEIKVYKASDCAANGAVVGSPVAQGSSECQFGKEGTTFVEFDHVEEEETVYIVVVETPVGVTIKGQIGAQSSASGTCGGDPHFRRWGNEVRDTFHGECDLVFLHQEEIAGEPLDVHVRTTMTDSYSYVSGVAVQYGDDKVEFQHDAMFINGNKVDNEERNAFGDDNDIVLKDANKRRFELNIKSRVAIEVFSTKKYMGINVNGNKLGLGGSIGILGEFGTGDMIARDGSKMLDFQDFGFEWQVNPTVDPQIFMDAREPQLPYERCRMPSVSAESRRRKLRGQDRKLYEQAVTACTENHIPANVQSCVDDVMFTGELELAFDN